VAVPVAEAAEPLAVVADPHVALGGGPLGPWTGWAGSARRTASAGRDLCASYCTSRSQRPPPKQPKPVRVVESSPQGNLMDIRRRQLELIAASGCASVCDRPHEGQLLGTRWSSRRSWLQQ